MDSTTTEAKYAVDPLEQPAGATARSPRGRETAAPVASDAAGEASLLPPLTRRLAAEAIGTGLLVMSVVGPGILGRQLTVDNDALVLLVSALTTAAMLFVLIKWFAPLSGAHFNPVITCALAFRGDIAPAMAAAYVPTQAVGAIAGVGIANAMFDTTLFSLATVPRGDPSYWLSEAVSTFGLVGVVWSCSRTQPSSLAGVVAAYVGAGFWCTATGFANPALTFARAFTDSFAGIHLRDVPALIAAEFLAAIGAVIVFRWLHASERANEKAPAGSA